jgi:hypothetical protein
VWEDSGADAGGAFTTNPNLGHPTMFTDFVTGDLIVITGGERDSNGADRTKVVRIQNATSTPIPTDIQTTVMGATEGADKYLEGGPSADVHRRWSVFVDDQTVPGTVRTFLTTWIPTGSTETWEWKGVGAEIELVAGGAGVSGDDIVLPYNTVGGGHRSPSTARISIGDVNNPPAEAPGGTKIYFRGSGIDTAKTVTFRGVDDQGTATTVVPIVAASLEWDAGLLHKLEGYWQLNSSLLDSSGNGRTLIAAGVLTYAAGKFGNGYFSNGTNGNYLTYNVDDPDFDFDDAGDSYAMSCWVNLDDFSGTPTLMSKMPSGAFNGWWFYVDSGGRLSFTIGDGGGGTHFRSPAAAMSTSAGFQHALVSCDGVTLKLYIDGVEVHSSPTQTILNSTNAIHLGGVAAFFSLDGTMDEAAIWSRHITPDEVGYIYNAGSGFLLDGDTPFAVAPTISGNTIINLLPDASATLYNVSLDTTTAGIDEGETGLLTAELS